MNAHPQSFKPALPDALRQEQALLGAVFVNNAAFVAVEGLVSVGDFGEPLHRKIFEVVTDLIRMGKTANPVTLSSFLPSDIKVGDLTVVEYMIALVKNAVTVVLAPEYAKAVRDAAVRRQLALVGEDIYNMACAPDPKETTGDMIDQAQTMLFDLDRGGGAGRMVTATDEADRMMSGQGGRLRPTVPLPLPQLEEVMGAALEAGNLYGMLSGSGEGKTSMVLQIVRHAAECGHPVLFLSYDQLWDQCLLQMVSQKLGIEHARLKDEDRLQTAERERKWEAISDLRSLPMAYRKCSGRRDGSAQITGYARRFLTTFAPKYERVPLIVLDHVRKVLPRNERDHEGRISAEVNGACKDVAAEYDAVWLSLNQRSSAGAKRKNPRPIDADLYGGEMAREDYDGMFYLYRAWKYRTAQLATAADEREEKDIEARFAREKWEPDQAELGALKVRFGDPSVRRRIRFEAEFTRYVSMREAPPPELFEDRRL